MLHAAYDPANGELGTLTMPDGGTLTYMYDADGRPRSLTWGGTITGTVQLTSTLQGQIAAQRVNTAPSIAFAYDAAGALTQAGDLALHNDPVRARLIGSALGVITDTWHYNAFSEPSHYQAAISGTAALAHQYQRDATSRIITKTETLSGTTTVYSYTYDLAGQLREVWQDGTRTAHYLYDSNGNRLSVSGPGGTTNGIYNVQDQLLQYGTATYTYTLNGEVASKTSGNQTTTYTYDAFGNLTGTVLPDSTSITYVLDGEGRRIGKRVNGALVQGFLYQDALRPIAELDGAGNVVSQFVYASQLNVPAYLIKNGHAYRILTDQLGSPRLVVDAQTGQVAQRLDYDVFGAIIFDSNPGFQPFGFAGGLYDQHTKLTHFGAREYDAETGRWTSKDPLVFGGGDTNLYRYVGNDPVNFVDPTGRFLFALALVGLVAGVVGSALGQLMAHDGKWQCINPLDLAIAGVFGFVAGGIGPGTLLGAIGLGALANTAQYFVTQYVHSENPTGGGALFSAVTGALAGWVGGKVSRLIPGNTIHLDEGYRAPGVPWFSDAELSRFNDPIIEGANTGIGNGIRNISGGITSNAPSSLELGCNCQ